MGKFCRECKFNIIPPGIPESNYYHWQCGYRTLVNPVNGSNYHPRCVVERAFAPDPGYHAMCDKQGVNWRAKE